MRASSRRRVVRRAALALTAPVLAVLVAVSPAGPAAAAPSDQPGGTSGVLDSEALDRLQQRAAEVQADLQQRQTEVAAARQALTEAEAAVEAARSSVAEAEGELARHRTVVAAYASAVYRDGGALTPSPSCSPVATPATSSPHWAGSRRSTRTPPRSSVQPSGSDGPRRPSGWSPTPRWPTHRGVPTG